MSVLLETSLGDIVIDLFVNETPGACTNFLKLCKIKYYNSCVFFNVQPDFVLQTGDPSGTGKQGESIFHQLQLPSTYLKDPFIQTVQKGQVGLVLIHPDPVTGKGIFGSQFMFYMTSDDHSSLQHRGAVFGEVAEGMEVLEKINQAYVDSEGRPYQDIRIRHTVILDDPFPDPPGLVVPDRSPEPHFKESLDLVRLDDQEIVEVKDDTTLAKEKREKEAHSNALALEIMGDLPFADIKPPENVLFVCRLNPVTQDEDLAMIFSRFGKLSSCEIIKDKLTQESLCYAFIEFDDPKACEMAYFKMDNVLIDDRRIKVDFSQSVSKLHREWILAKKKQALSNTTAGYGGFAHLTRKTKYRNEGLKNDVKGEEGEMDELERDKKKYPLIFEHDADLKSGQELESTHHEIEAISKDIHQSVESVLHSQPSSSLSQSTSSSFSSSISSSSKPHSNSRSYSSDYHDRDKKTHFSNNYATYTSSSSSSSSSYRKEYRKDRSEQHPSRHRSRERSRDRYRNKPRGHPYRD